MRGRRLTVLTAAAAAGVLAMASMAWACTNLIRIDGVSPSVEQPAASVVVRGAQAVGNSTVHLRWNRVDGPVLAEARADGAGSFSATMDVPQVSPGIYVITATSEGNVARAAMAVGLGGALTPYDAGAALAASPDGSGSSTGMTVLAVGLLLLASGTVVVWARRTRGVRAPATGASAARSAERLEDFVEVGR